MNLLQLLQEGDGKGLEMEKARQSVESAKAALEQAKLQYESAKESFESVLAQADEAGVSKAKFKKLLEERTAALVASGLLQPNETANVVKPIKAAKPPKKAKANKVIESEQEESKATADDDFDNEDELTLLNSEESHDFIETEAH